MWPKCLPYFLRFLYIVSAIDNLNVKIKRILTQCQNNIMNKNSMNLGSI